MKTAISATFAAVFLFCSLTLADETKPIELTAAQMDQITAGTLRLDNGTGGKLIFVNFDHPEPGCDGLFCHPALNARADSADTATEGHGPSVNGVNDGPWVATAASPMITCVGFQLDGAGTQQVYQ